MTKLTKYTLAFNKKKEVWDLKNDKTNQVLKSFENKENATKGGVLKKAVGGEGSVKIKKLDNHFQEERTFPKSKDPTSSPG